MNVAYVVPRVIRHFLPERIVRFLLLRSMIIKPGLETVDPEGAVRRYMHVLRSKQTDLAGKRVLVFGYGGRFDVGVALLERALLTWCCAIASPNPMIGTMLALGDRYPEFLRLAGSTTRPNPDHMQLIDGGYPHPAIAGG